MIPRDDTPARLSGPILGDHEVDASLGKPGRVAHMRALCAGEPGPGPAPPGWTAGEFAVCAGSVGLTMAESFLRHGRTGQAASAVSAMVRALEQALALAGA